MRYRLCCARVVSAHGLFGDTRCLRLRLCESQGKLQHLLPHSSPARPLSQSHATSDRALVTVSKQTLLGMQIVAIFLSPLRSDLCYSNIIM